MTLNKSISVASRRGKHIKYLPYAFTEHGVAMLSSVLNGERVIQVNILIMRAFTKLREILLTHKELAAKIEALEKSVDYGERALSMTMDDASRAKRANLDSIIQYRKKSLNV